MLDFSEDKNCSNISSTGISRVEEDLSRGGRCFRAFVLTPASVNVTIVDVCRTQSSYLLVSKQTGIDGNFLEDIELEGV